MQKVRTRAAPLAPEDRRRVIIDATVPLLRTYGRAVTTKQIAEAAGVAEGTLFRVFPDKEALVDAAIRTAFAPGPLLADLAHVERSLPLDDRLTAVVVLLQARLQSIIDLMSAVGLRAPPDDAAGARHDREHRPVHAAFLEAVAEILEPDRARLTRSPYEVARILRLVTFAGTHVGISDGQPLTPTEIVSIVLDGVRRHGPNPLPLPHSRKSG